MNLNELNILIDLNEIFPGAFLSIIFGILSRAAWQLILAGAADICRLLSDKWKAGSHLPADNVNLLFNRSK